MPRYDQALYDELLQYLMANPDAAMGARNAMPGRQELYAMGGDAPWVSALQNRPVGRWGMGSMARRMAMGRLPMPGGFTGGMMPPAPPPPFVSNPPVGGPSYAGGTPITLDQLRQRFSGGGMTMSPYGGNMQAHIRGNMANRRGPFGR